MRMELTLVKWVDSFRIKSIPKVFNKAFDKHEKKIRAMLEDVKKTQSS